ncbi:MAG: DUF4340 domain-containing protein [Planctomycetota bacterium]
MRLVTLLALALLVIVLIIVLVIGAGGWFRVRQSTPQGERLLDLTEPDVTSLTLGGPRRSTVELRKRDDAWFMTSPVCGRADDTAVRRALLALFDLRIARTFRPTDPQRPPTDQTGLGAPRLVARLTDLAGRHYVVKLGDRPPLIRHTYVQFGTTNDFLLVSPDPTEDLDRPVGAFRDKRLLAIDPADLRRVVVTGRQSYELRRTADRWELIPDGRPAVEADGARVAALLDHLTGLEIEAFPPEPAASLDGAGLDPPDVAFVLTTDPAADNPVVVQVGSHEGAVYAMVTNDGWPVKLHPTALAPLIEPSESLRDRRLLPVEAGAIARVTFRRDGRAVTVSRRDGRWIAPEGPALAAGRLDGLTAALTEPRIGDFIPTYTSLRGFGLDDPSIRCEIELADGTVSTLILGATDADERIYLQRDGDPTVIMARGAELATLAEALLGPTGERNRPPVPPEVPGTQPAP